MELSTREYADKRGITMRAVTKAIVKGHKLPGVKSIKRLHQYYILVIDQPKFKLFLAENQSVKK